MFVKKYAKYLEEKVSVVRNLGFEFEKNKNILKETKIPKAFKIIGKLQSQLNALLNCRIKSQNSNLNALISRCYVLLLNDSIILYGTLNDGLLHLLDVYWKLHQKEAKKVVDIYKLFVKETDALINLYDIGRRFIHKLPHVNKVCIFFVTTPFRESLNFLVNLIRSRPQLLNKWKRMHSIKLQREAEETMKMMRKKNKLDTLT